MSSTQSVSSKPQASDYTGTWKIDPSHIVATFVAKHLMISKVRGQFAKVDGTIEVGKDLESTKINISIDASSIESHDEKRDGHLKSEDFLNVEKYPKLNFASTEIVEKGDGKWLVRGDFTIRDITKPLELEVDWEGEQEFYGKRHIGFSAKGEFDRTDWNLSWNMPLDTGGVLVGEKVKIEIETELIQD